MRKPHFPTLTSDDLPGIFDEYEIEVRDKADARIEHWPILAFAWLAITLSGKDWEDFQQGVPVLFSFSVKATFYPHGGLPAEDVRTGDVSKSDMPGIVHELTHCFRWIELGYVRTALTYVLIPLPTVKTGRSTEEFIAEANELLWILNEYRPYNDYIRRHINGSAKVFTSATYLWPTLDKQGWKNALRRMTTYSQSEPTLDALDAVSRYGTYSKFGGYLIG